MITKLYIWVQWMEYGGECGYYKCIYAVELKGGWEMVRILCSKVFEI